MKMNYSTRERYAARDISWLKFNKRVLYEALDKDNPLLERLKFLAIFVSNLDEFYMVRVASIRNLVDSGIKKIDRFGFYPRELLEEVCGNAKKLTEKLYSIYKDICLDGLSKNKIKLLNLSQFKREHKKLAKEYFDTILYPIITPLGVDPGHPFPVLPSKTMAIAVHLKRKGDDHLAIVPIPKNMPRILRIPSRKDEYTFMFIEDILLSHLNSFFKGYKIKDFALFRVIRDSELGFEEELTPDLLKSIEGEVKKRSIAKVVYLEVEQKCSSDLLYMLCEGLQFDREEVVGITSRMDLTYLFELISYIDKPELLYPGFVPQKLEYDDIFEKIKEGDFSIHVPYQSFDPTVDLIRAAAKDEKVLAIKMTLYRANKDSAIIAALKEAAENNKQVTILVELKARFDEENNIRWAKELEMVGCHVIYGIPGLKVHSKMTLIVRKENGVIQRYAHLATGNYNENTAKIYSDIGYFTDNEDFAKDISDMFNVVTGYSMPSEWKRIVTAPRDLRNYLIALINREIKFHKKNKNGEIFVKLNSLEDNMIIDKLYEASKAGVKIKLTIRGVCCLIPGVKGLSENIRVKSIVGRFLEHTRIIIFNNNNNPRVFLSSADWMKRNFDRRIELLFEIYKEEIKVEMIETMNQCWSDNTKSWEVQSDGNYKKTKDKRPRVNFQETLITKNSI